MLNFYFCRPEEGQGFASLQTCQIRWKAEEEEGLS